MVDNYFWENIICWYEKNKRKFPWRNTDNAFHVLIAEILLQQTNVRKVTPVYKEIINRYSKPSKMSEADLKDLEELIKPLGLLYRAERLIKISKIITDKYNGLIPEDKADLKFLPGVGEYIADAVLCYGYNENTVPVDTNVIRLFTRYYSIKSDNVRKRTDKKLIKEIESKYKVKNFKKANLAVLDFSSKICEARNPKCKQCCLSKKCNYYNNRSEVDG
jgi:A/G-specific adenine glycosylase